MAHEQETEASSAVSDDVESNVVSEAALLQPSHMQEVLPRLFIGDYRASQDFGELRRHGVSHIISASEFVQSPESTRVPPFFFFSLCLWCTER
jgi:hypothetical protein